MRGGRHGPKRLPTNPPMSDGAPLAPGATIGILGGGQLGRMIALAAATLGLRTHVFAPDRRSPAFEVAASSTCAPYEDETALARFAESADLVTYEFENVPATTAGFLAGRMPLRPGALALETSQDRLAEKMFVSRLGIATAPFRKVDDVGELERGLDELGRPAILKTRRFGYDGKGQVRLGEHGSAEAALAEIGRMPAVLEGFVPFAHEVSIVAARSTDGSFAAYDPCLNTHRDGILSTTEVPSGLAPDLCRQAVGTARRIADALGYVGVLAVELFVMADGSLVVNEIAPRVHNSGHWTIEGAETSQFEQHVRAICGWPLGDTRRRGRVTMRNLIGPEIDRWPDVLATPGAHLHHYGKTAARPGRKMGHVTTVSHER